MNVDRDTSASAAAVEIARRVLARDAVTRGVHNAETQGAALQRACSHVSENLRDAMGDAGWTALLSRALVQAEGDHPALKSLRRVGEGCFHLDGVVESVEIHGIAAVTTAVEALLAALVDVLTRLIGEDMAVKLIDREAVGKQKLGGAS